MKNLILILCLALLAGIEALSQEQIIDIHGNTFNAFVVKSTKDSLTIIDEFNSEIIIPASQIKSRERLFCEIMTNKGKKFTANLGKVFSQKVHFYTKSGEELIIDKLDFVAIMLNNRKLNSANWRPLSFDELLLED